ncbi:MAG: diaminopimelate epimerase [Nitrospirae bacterium]|nr:diaminopimelate epimerase [Nitrospirota bacterium]
MMPDKSMRKSIHFYKMSGSGNDFIMIDNRSNVLKGLPVKRLTQKLCRRGLSVGADGLILIEKSTKADFKWRYLNADGEEASFCGNGARCAAYFAVLQKIAKPALTFETLRGIISARVKKNSVRVSMMSPERLELGTNIFLNSRKWEGNFMVMGVPHWVHFSRDIDEINVPETGPKVRYHPRFLPEGTNANFVDILTERELRIRTYERGVEAETLACGTGAVASVLVGRLLYKMTSPVTVYPKGDIPLKVHFKETGGEFSDIYLEGDARVIFEGVLAENAWEY